MSQINSKNTENYLADALTELTDTRAFKDISITEVAFKANMHRNTVYYHFKDMQELTTFAVRYELSKTVNLYSSSEAAAPAAANYSALRDALAYFFTRFKPLLDFTRNELGLENFLSLLRTELLPLIEPFVQSEFVNSDERKRAGVDIFTQQILVAYLALPRPDNMIRLVFDNVMPELLGHAFL